jgi:uncharacterized membrane protein
MNQFRQTARIAFALSFIGLGIFGFVYGDFASAWPAWVPLRTPLLYASAALMLLCGAGMLVPRTVPAALRIFIAYLVFWLALRVPTLVMAPLVEVNYFAIGEIAVPLAAALRMLADWVPSSDNAIARFAGSARGRRTAGVLFGLSLVAFGLSHFFYTGNTTPLVPAYFPFHSSWAYITGAAHIAAGLGVLFNVLAPLAATMEGVMLTIFTVLVWVPRIITAPETRGNWSEFIFSWLLTAAAFVVAASLSSEAQQPPPN